MEKLFVAIPEGEVKSTFVPESVQQFAEKNFDVTYAEKKLSKEEIKPILMNYDAVLTGWGSCMLDKDVLEGNDRLKLIVHTGGTVGNLVDSYAYEQGKTVFSGNIMYAESVAEGVLAYMLMAQRRIPDYISAVENGEWRTETVLWEGLLDKTVGIIGLGTISRLLIPLLKPFRVKIKLFTRYRPDDEFIKENNITMASVDEIFSTCDIVSVHSALNAENRGLITKEYFEMLKDNALFVNTARGDVIDEEALIEELKKNRFRAVLDVYHTEPLDKESELRTLKNVYCLPHMAGPTLDRREKITTALLAEARSFFDGNKNSRFEISADVAKRMTKM